MQGFLFGCKRIAKLQTRGSEKEGTHESGSKIAFRLQREQASVQRIVISLLAGPESRLQAAKTLLRPSPFR